MPRTNPTRTHIAAYGLGATPVGQLGIRVHTVEHPAFGCPVTSCGTSGPMEVYVTAVRWMCGHTRTLPKHNQDCYPGCFHNTPARLAARRPYHQRHAADSRASARARRLAAVA
jgi:hypothetical protein